MARCDCADLLKSGSNHLRWTYGAGLIVAVVGAGVTPGCASKKPVDPWTPQPTVRWFDLGTRPVLPPRDGFFLELDQRDPGLFPAAIAVARVAIVDDEVVDLLERPKLVRNPRNEFLQWNTALEDQFAVSELFPIATWDLGGGTVAMSQILAAFRALGAQLGLVYAVNETTPDHTELLGVLYDIRTYEPLALLHTEATSTVTREEAKKSKKPIDYWTTDSRALARAKFAIHFHDCIRNLILDDEPAASAMPASWHSNRPRRTVEWPPTERQRRP